MIVIDRNKRNSINREEDKQEEYANEGIPFFPRSQDAFIMSRFYSTLRPTRVSRDTGRKFQLNLKCSPIPSCIHGKSIFVFIDGLERGSSEIAEAPAKLPHSKSPLGQNGKHVDVAHRTESGIYLTATEEEENIQT